MQRVLIETGLGRCTDGDQAQHDYHVPAHAMILPHRLRLTNTAVQVRCIVLRDPHYGLYNEETVGDEAEDGMDRDKMLTSVCDFIILDNHETCNQGGEAAKVKDGMSVGALGLLLWGVGGLENEDGLCYQKNTGRIEELRRGSVHAIVWDRRKGLYWMS